MDTHSRPPKLMDRVKATMRVERHVAAATQNQALNALVFLYRHVLEQPLGDIGECSRARRPRRLPVVLSHKEVKHVLGMASRAPEAPWGR